MRLPSDNVSHVLIGIPLGLVLGIVIYGSLQAAEPGFFLADHLASSTGVCADVCTPEGEDLPGHTCPDVCRRPLCCNLATNECESL